jgi:hypothetical protein
MRVPFGSRQLARDKVRTSQLRTLSYSLCVWELWDPLARAGDNEAYLPKAAGDEGPVWVKIGTRRED